MDGIIFKVFNTKYLDVSDGEHDTLLMCEIQVEIWFEIL